MLVRAAEADDIERVKAIRHAAFAAHAPSARTLVIHSYRIRDERMTRDPAPPFTRAIRRVEAELMLLDANQIGSPGAIERTYEQRAADALVLRCQRITATVRAADKL